MVSEVVAVAGESVEDVMVVDTWLPVAFRGQTNEEDAAVGT